MLQLIFFPLFPLPVWCWVLLFVWCVVFSLFNSNFLSVLSKQHIITIWMLLSYGTLATGLLESNADINEM